MKHINDWNVRVNPHYFKPYDAKDTKPLDRAVKKFNRKIKDAGIMPEIQDRMHFISRSEKRRKKKSVGTHRNKREQLAKNF